MRPAQSAAIVPRPRRLPRSPPRPTQAPHRSRPSPIRSARSADRIGWHRSPRSGATRHERVAPPPPPRTRRGRADPLDLRGPQTCRRTYAAIASAPGTPAKTPSEHEAGKMPAVPGERSRCLIGRTEARESLGTRRARCPRSTGSGRDPRSAARRRARRSAPGGQDARGPRGADAILDRPHEGQRVARHAAGKMPAVPRGADAILDRPHGRKRVARLAAGRMPAVHRERTRSLIGRLVTREQLGSARWTETRSPQLVRRSLAPSRTKG